MRNMTKKSVISPRINVIVGVKSYLRLILSDKDRLLNGLSCASWRLNIFYFHNERLSTFPNYHSTRQDPML